MRMEQQEATDFRGAAMPTADREEALFAAALEKPTRAERAAYLEGACGDDHALRARLEALLAAHDASGGVLDAPPLPLTPTGAYRPLTEGPGTVIGPYKLLQQIGEGGMGVVYMAEQQEPVRRKVALKIIKPGMDSEQVIARFEAERQALALMDHQNIARVLDAGTTESGWPYFVMELVHGVPITRFCDDNRLTPRERLLLFVPVCQAIQHAHQKGIIHRDVKPSNVLVTLYDDKPVPKVIDFGVAKAIEQRLTEKTLFTQFGALVGTFEYMSPEQAEMNAFGVDTRSDIYSLGVLLYELLTGTTPLERTRLREAALDEMVRLIREEEAPRPSQRLSSSNNLPKIAAARKTEPARLSKLVRGEIDWIVMKALEKDRSRRYETVNGFAADVQRYLAGEAVQAHPPSAAYRLRKFVQRHRGPVTAAAAVLLALVAGVIGTTAGLFEARQQRDAARRAEGEARQAEAVADDRRREVERTAASLQVDLDLAEVKTDEKLGLLRLARTLKGLPADARDLREFTVAAVLATGQDFAPLLPPITHDGQPVAIASLSPNRQTLLTLGKDYTARLWDTRTGRPIAVLRNGDERVVNCGLSPDGRTVFTADETDVARFWEVPGGKMRTRTRPRQYSTSRANQVATLVSALCQGASVANPWQAACMAERISGAGAIQQETLISNDRLLRKRVVVEPSGPPLHGYVVNDEASFVELWDTATGRLVARLDAPGRDINSAQFLGERWVTRSEGSSTLLVLSAEDGRLLARLSHPAGEGRPAFLDVSPTGHRIATRSEKPGGSVIVREWDVETWQAQTLTTIPFGWPRYWTDDGGGGSVLASGYEGDWVIYRAGQSEPIAEFPGAFDWLGARAGDLAHGGNGWVYDTRPWRRRSPPPGRKFHPDLAQFAPDGRFVVAGVNYGERCVIDTRTDKLLLTSVDWGNLSGFGLVAVSNQDGAGARVQLLPSASRLDLPADQLELWVQVAVRSELNSEGHFVKWDEPTWERKRQQLAVAPVSYPDLPFPGYVATDKLHWLRAEFGEAKTDADKLRIAGELLRRAESAGDRAEAVRWRAEKDRLEPQVAPPRVGKP
jgi:serine/threonine protein kinase